MVFAKCSAASLYFPSFPTRRSSDLDQDGSSPGFDRILGYGYGLVIEQFADLGEVISHSGGYPGYGSFMIWHREDRKSTRLNSSHVAISYAVFCLKKKI